eukprot:scaffold26895_cov34-Phaeocystis_antarctica.AAC.2
MAVTKMHAVTLSKQWIHLRRSLRCPPTSNIVYFRSLISKCCWTMPVVRTRARSESCSVGR